MIQINSDKCVGCGSCIPVCPFDSIELKEAKAQFKPEAWCIDCFHCAAACPQEAIFRQGQAASAGQIAPFSAGFGEELANLFKSRRSCRNFTAQPVPRQIIEEALSLTAWAPTGCNEQGLKWLVVNDQDKLAEFARIMAGKTAETLPQVAQMLAKGINMISGNASTLLVAYAENRPDRCFAQDAAIAAAYVELWLRTQGLSSCWSGFTMIGASRIPELKTRILGLAEDDQVLAALMVGYPQQQNYCNYPLRKPCSIKWI